MRILLLSLYYPPLNTIAASRIEAFEKYLSLEGHTVDVITRYYDVQQQKGESMLLGNEEPVDFKEEYIRKNNIIYSNFRSENSKLTFSKKLPPIIRGIYNYYNIDVFHYGWLSYLLNSYEKEFSKNKYDFIISSYGPPIMLLAAKIISKKSNTPYIIDFRDSYIDERDKGFHLFFKNLIQKKILAKASAILFSTEGMRDFFFSRANSNLKYKYNCVVYNGIDPDVDSEEKNVNIDVVEAFKKIKEQNELVLLHTGTLYQGQNIDFFINAVKKFNDSYGKKIALVFLGLAENNAFFRLNMKGVIYLPKVSRPSAIRLQKLADALILPVWDGRYTGFSGKTIEYLASGNVVLCSPYPQDDMLIFFDKSGNVKVLNDYELFENVCFDIIKGNIKGKSVSDNSVFTRQYWIRQLSVFLKELNKKL
jgi:hypothetical protein